MASPDSDNSEEYLFLDLELLSALSIPQNSAELKSTVQEINEALSEQLVEIKNLKSQYRTLKEKVKTTAKTNDEMNLEIATLKDELQTDERALEKMKSQGRNISQKCTLDLCYTLTKLKWNTDCPKNVVAGGFSLTFSPWLLERLMLKLSNLILTRIQMLLFAVIFGTYLRMQLVYDVIKLRNCDNQCSPCSWVCT